MKRLALGRKSEVADVSSYSMKTWYSSGCGPLAPRIAIYLLCVNSTSRYHGVLLFSRIEYHMMVEEVDYAQPINSICTYSHACSSNKQTKRVRKNCRTTILTFRWQRQLGLVKGVPLSPTSDGTGSPTLFDAARAAMCLLKEVRRPPSNILVDLNLFVP